MFPSSLAKTLVFRLHLLLQLTPLMSRHCREENLAVFNFISAGVSKKRKPEMLFAAIAV